MTPPVRTVLHHVGLTTAELQSCPEDERFEWLLEVAAQCVAWAAVVLEGEREPAA